MARRNPIQSAQGFYAEYDYLAGWCDDPPPMASKSQRKRMKDLLQTRHKQLRDQQRERYESVIDEGKGIQKRVRESVDEGRTAVAQLVVAVKSGRLDPEEAKAQLTQLMQGTRDHHARLDSVDKSNDAATEMVDSHPRDYEAYRRERFHNAGEPFVTEAWLAGDDSPDLDPFGRRGGDQ